MNFIDLFAGAGGLSEGFIRAGFDPIAHIEADEAACFTLKTRMAYHWLKKNNQIEIYNDYLNGHISRSEFYESIPNHVLESVINEKIGVNTLATIFNKIDAGLNGEKVDLIVGGPPCQAYSIVGRARDKNKMLGDERNYLYSYYAEFLKKYNPKFFVFENVKGLLSAKDAEGTLYISKMTHLFEDCGYKIEYKIISANEFGVLQKRDRVILIGKKGTETGFYPEFEKWIPRLSVSEIFKGLPAINAGEGSSGPTKIIDFESEYLIKAGIVCKGTPVCLHSSRPNTQNDLEIYRIAVERWNNGKQRLDYNDLPENLKNHKNRTSFTDRFKVVAAENPYSHTVVAHISKDGHYYIHPDIKQNRSLTPREAARLQTFPDDYHFENISEISGRTAAFKQIGNAVPVLLAKEIADKIRCLLDGDAT